MNLSAGSAEWRSLILRIADAGELVGIPCTISGQPYEVTAEALEPIQANFIPRDEFLRFLRAHGDAALRVAEILCRVYQATYQEVESLGLSGSAEGKVARFLLDLTHSRAQDIESIRATLTLTHEEIAQMMGASRGTVTRLLTSFKKKRLIEIHGSKLVVKSRANLEKLVKT